MPAAEGEGGIVIGHRHPIVGFQQPSVPGNPMIGTSNRRPLIKTGMRTNAGAACLDNYWPHPNFCTPSQFFGVVFGTICGHMRASRLMSCVHDRRRLTDWELLLIGDICWGSGVASIQPPVRFIFGSRTSVQSALCWIKYIFIASGLVWQFQFFLAVIASGLPVAWRNFYFCLSFSKSELERKEKVC